MPLLYLAKKEIGQVVVGLTYDLHYKAGFSCVEHYNNYHQCWNAAANEDNGGHTYEILQIFLLELAIFSMWTKYIVSPPLGLVLAEIGNCLETPGAAGMGSDIDGA